MALCLRPAGSPPLARIVHYLQPPPPPTPSAPPPSIQLHNSAGEGAGRRKTEEAAPILAFQQGGLNEAIKQNYFLLISLSIFLSLEGPPRERSLPPPSPGPVSRTGGEDSERGSGWAKVTQRVGGTARAGTPQGPRTPAGEGGGMSEVGDGGILGCPRPGQGVWSP